MKIGFIGVGKLGQPCAEEIAKKGHDVTGFDIVERHSDLISIKPTLLEAVHDRDIVFIAVPTPHEKQYDGSVPSSHLAPRDFDYSIVEQCIRDANSVMRPNQLLVLISTVLPGTTRERFIPLVTNTRFVYNPYLIAMGSVGWDMINPEMVLIGTQDGDLNGDAAELIDFYQTIMENNPRYEVGTWDECECIKVFYNTFISAKIGIVNMIQDVAERQENINVDVVTQALAASTMRIMGPQYMTAGMGDGGGCHPRDNIALRFMAEKLGLGYDLFDSIMSAREQQAKNIASELVKHNQNGRLPIVIHGKAYKPNVEYTDGSYSLLVAHYVRELGYNVQFIDPLTDNRLQITGPCVFLLAHNASVTYKYTGQSYENQLYCKIPAGSVVIDPWRTYVNPDVTVIPYGNTRPKSTI